MQSPYICTADNVSTQGAVSENLVSSTNKPLAERQGYGVGTREHLCFVANPLFQQQALKMHCTFYTKSCFQQPRKTT